MNAADEPTASQIQPGRVILIALLLGLLFAAQSWAVHDFYTTILPGGNDFYPRWAGARALLTEGRNPYGDDVTAEIAAVLDPRGQRTNSFNFAFPLNVLLVMGPLGLLDYPWAQAVWMVSIVWAGVGLIVALFFWLDWRPRPAGAGALILGTLLFYPVARTIFLGQFTVHMTLFLALSLLLYRRGRDGWAGFCLSLTAIKPQMVILVAPWLVLWALRHRRYRFVWGLLAGGLGALLLTLLILPTWPLDFYHGLFDYSEVAAGRNPLAVFVGYFWRDGQPLVAGLLSLLLLLGLGQAGLRAWRGNEAQFLAALAWTMVVSLLIAFQTGTTNQVMLLIPLLAGAHAWLKARGPALVIAVAVALLFGLWILFQQTVIRTSAENDIMFLPLPFFTLALLLAQLVKDWRARRAA